MIANKARRVRLFQFRLDGASGVPIYRQIIDQVLGGIASGALAEGDQLPTVRQVSVDLAVNPNTVVRAYRELELRGALETQQGTGTFIAQQASGPDSSERRRLLTQFVSEFAARAGSAGFTVREVLNEFSAQYTDSGRTRR